ncbi:hypothetical protein AG1IA_09977 [Rhizoctonia solani AG-1 IA]|uniref:Uncharacterized protein n=1 Tax=Thanatephorus cucumeris (strain AG1-IA) TaxID=983506 RepID=L8WGT1_THACA|nr:hypothetical protein AG1IA_09977 [Rhizoctonia solani AG-1 IA]
MRCPGIATHSPCLYSYHQYRVCVMACYLGDAVADRVIYIHPISRDPTSCSLVRPSRNRSV